MTIDSPRAVDSEAMAAHLHEFHGRPADLAHFMCFNSLKSLHEHAHGENIPFLPHFHTESEGL